MNNCTCTREGMTHGCIDCKPESKDRFYTSKELERLKFKRIGKNINIARTCVIPEPHRISLGSNIEISDFCILTGDIEIDDYTHIAHYVHLSGHYGIKIGKFVGVGSRTTIYTESDDYKHPVIGPTIPQHLRKTYHGPVILEDYVAIGIGCFIMPNTRLFQGASLNIRSNAWGNFLQWKEYVSRYPNESATFKRVRSKDLMKSIEDELLEY